jgi:multidrug resistance protein MdtO
LNIELTLWQILATAIGALITLLVEVVFRYYSPTDELASGIDARLRAIEDLLDTRDGMIGTSFPVAQSITQYAVVGAGALRQQLARGHYSALKRTRQSAFVALLGRSLDLCAAIVAAHSEPGSIQPRRAEDLRRRISFLRQAVKAGTDTPRGHSPEPTIDGAPLFFELEVTVGLMESVLDASADMDPRLTLLEDPGATQRLFARDAFTNRDHVKFALAGTAAAMLCYVLYTALDWPGISTAVTTCLLTALSNIGSSRQKQMLRIGGAMIGGFVFGLGSQILILPYIDSIAGFSVLVAVVTGISAYVATSSPRLSYAGLQMAFAFYLINNTGFSISLDLTTSRDRVIGVLVGIAAMWLVFERIHPRPAASEMVRTFAQSARLIASLRPEASGETEILRIRSIRNQVSQLFTSVNAEADAVLFESGEDRISHLAARDRIRRWLSTLRTIYLLELPLLQFRVSVDRHQISPAYGDIEARLFGELSQSLNSIADSLESELGYAPRVHEDRPNIEHLSPGISSHDNPPGPAEEEVLRNLMTLLPRLAAQLEAEVQTKLVFAP